MHSEARRQTGPGDRPSRPQTVVYVVGAARSGSTLLASLLGMESGCFAAAETRLLWRNLDKRRCGCGEMALACPIWAHTVRYVRNVTGAEPSDVVSLQRRTTQLVNLPSTALHAAKPGASLLQYAEIMQAVYAGLHEATGAQVIVDSSKNPSEALLLRSIETVSPHVIHLVRDPRAVVYSWQRASVDASADGNYRNAASAAARWVAHNIGAHVATSKYEVDRTTLVRYEDLLQDPRRIVRRLVQSVSDIDTDLGWLDDVRAVPLSRHMIGGNALRESKGPIQLASDDQWRTTLRNRSRVVVNVVALPYARRYGYRWRAETMTPPANSTGRT